MSGPGVLSYRRDTTPVPRGGTIYRENRQNRPYWFAPLLTPLNHFQVIFSPDQQRISFLRLWRRNINYATSHLAHLVKINTKMISLTWDWTDLGWRAHSRSFHEQCCSVTGSVHLQLYYFHNLSKKAWFPSMKVTRLYYSFQRYRYQFIQQMRLRGKQETKGEKQETVIFPFLPNLLHAFQKRPKFNGPINQNGFERDTD